MCLQDLWIARHTIAKRIGTTSPITIPANFSRLALLVIGTKAVDIVDQSGAVWYTRYMDAVPTGYLTTDTNEVPPTDNTGTITASVVSNNYATDILRVEQYGSLITAGGTLTYATITSFLYELVPDPVLARVLADLELKSGWPWPIQT